MADTPTTPRKNKRRWLRIVLGLLVLIVLLVLLAPTLLSTGPGKSFVLGQVNKNLRGRVEADAISVGWFSPARVSGLRVYGPDGQQILAAPHVTTQLTAAKALTAPMQVGDVDVKVAQVHLITYQDGSTNLQRAFASRTPAAKPSAPESPSPAKTGKPGEPVRANVNFVVDDVTWDTPGAETVRAMGTAGKLQLDTSGKPLLFELLTQVATGSRKPATITVNANLNAFENGNIKPLNQITGHAVVDIGTLDATALQPLLVAYGLHVEQGTVAGKLRLEAPAPTAMLVQGDLHAESPLAVAGTALKGDRLTLQKLRIPIDVALAGSKINVKQLALESDLLNVAAQGDTSLLAIEALTKPKADRTLEKSKLTLKGNLLLKPLAAQLPHVLALQKDTRVDSGSAALDGEITAHEGKVHGRLLATLQDVTGTQAGRKIALEPFRAGVDAVSEKGRLQPTATVLMPAGGAAEGQTLSLKLEPKPENLNDLQGKARYDLTRLEAQLGQFIDLGQRQFKGIGELTARVVMTEDKDGTDRHEIEVDGVTRNFVAAGLLAADIREPELNLKFRGTHASNASKMELQARELAVTGKTLRFAIKDRPLLLVSTKAGTRIDIPAYTATVDARTWGPVLAPMAGPQAREIVETLRRNESELLVNLGGSAAISSGKELTVNASTTLDIAGKTIQFKLEQPAEVTMASGVLRATVPAYAASVDLAAWGPVAKTLGGKPMEQVIDTLTRNENGLVAKIRGKAILTSEKKLLVQITADDVDVPGKTILFRTGGKAVAISFDSASGLTAQVPNYVLQADLATWGPVAGSFAGMAEGTKFSGQLKSLGAALLPADGVLQYATTTTVNGFRSIPPKGDATLPPTNVVVDVHVAVDPKRSRFDVLDRFLVQEKDPQTGQGDSVRLEKGSRFAWGSADAKNPAPATIDAQGAAQYDLARLTKLLAGFLPEGMTGSGQRTVAFHLVGPLTSDAGLQRFRKLELRDTPPTAVGWDAINLPSYGLELGKADLGVTLRGGVLTLKRSVIPANGGAITVVGYLNLNEKQPTFVIPETPGGVPLIEQVRLNKQLAAGPLDAFPIAWGASKGESDRTVVTGTVNVNLNGASLPLDVAQLQKTGTISGVLSLEQFTSNAAIYSMLTNVVRLGQTENGVRSITVRDVRFELRDGKVRYQNFTLPMGSVTLSFSGEVGLGSDSKNGAPLSMDVTVSERRLPVPITVHLEGTTRNPVPKVDAKALEKSVQKTIENAGPKVLEDLLKRGLKKK